MTQLLDDVRPHTAYGLDAMLADRLSRRQTGEWAAQYDTTAHTPLRPVPTLETAGAAAATRLDDRPDPGTQRSNLAQVRELVYLNERGLIGDVEFEAHRRRLLDR